MFASALLISSGLWVLAHRHKIADSLVRDGLFRQLGIDAREEQMASRGVTLIGALALMLSGLLRLAG
jgi:hypothetical protein